MIGDEKAVPATPPALFVEAAAIPATCVPWPLSSPAALAVQVLVELMQFAPALVNTRAPKSGWVHSMPVSTTATVAPPPTAYVPG
jgi:hypothetical protein